MDDDDSLIGFTNSLNEVSCSLSEDSVKNPLLETQFLVRVEVSTQIYQLGNINRRFDELTADSMQINEASIPPQIVEFPIFVEEEEDDEEEENEEEHEEEEDDEEEEEDEDEDEDAEEEEEEEELTIGNFFVYGDIDRLVSNGIIKSRLSQTVKNVITRSRVMLMEIALMEKPKWIRLTLDIEVTKVYLEFEEDDYEDTVSRVMEESFEADNENDNAVKNPALQVLIKALETKKFEKEDDSFLVIAKGGRMIKSCGICLSEFLKGVDFVTKMPCTHVFHEGCILKWLERRGNCPLCRFEFEMPALIYF